jgi:hypothetical protein
MKIKPYVLLLLMNLFFLEGMTQDSLVKRRVYLGFSFSSYYEKIFTGPSVFPLASYMRRQQAPLRAGVDVKVRITQRFSLGTGLVADISRQVQDYLPGGILRPDDIAKIHSKYIALSIGLPMRADYRVTTGQVAFFVTGGWYSSMFVEQAIGNEITYGDGHKRTDNQKYTRRKGDQQLLILLQLGAGLDINLNRFKLQLFPLYEGGMDILYQSTFGTSYYQHRIGGMLSVYYNL